MDSYSVARRGKKREPDLFDPNLKFSIIYFQQRQQESSRLKKTFGRLDAVDSHGRNPVGIYFSKALRHTDFSAIKPLFVLTT